MAADHENVIAVSFQDDSRAYQALRDLRELDAHGLINLRVAVVLRREDGHVVVEDEVGDGELFPPTAAGGLIDLLIGIVGPRGILIGGSTGLLAGALSESPDEDETESVLAKISRSVSGEHATLLAQLSEPDPANVDTVMAGLGGTVLREPTGTLKAEIAAAEAAQRTAKRKARKALREQREAEHREAVRAKIRNSQRQASRAQAPPQREHGRARRGVSGMGVPPDMSQQCPRAHDSGVSELQLQFALVRFDREETAAAWFARIALADALFLRSYAASR